MSCALSTPRTHQAKERRHQIGVCILLASLIATSAFAQVNDMRSTQRYFQKWNEEARAINELLLAKEWKQASRHSKKLLSDIADHVFTGGAEVIGAALMERGVALAGLGQMQDAQWYACMADQFWTHTPEQLLRYGKTGSQLRQNLHSVEQVQKDADAAVVDDGLGLLVLSSDDLKPENANGPKRIGKFPGGIEVLAPKPTHIVQPVYPEGARLGRAEDRIIVQTIVSKQGVPLCPTVLEWSRHVTLAYKALDALKDWRFKPATLNGKPVDVYYTLTVHFELNR